MRPLFLSLSLLFFYTLFAIDETKIQPDGLVNGDGFGAATCLKGDVLIVGAPFADISGIDSVGVIQFFKRVSGNWVFQSEIPSPDVVANDFFGWTLDFDGDYLVVGAPFNDENGLDAGAVYIYEYDGTNFNFLVKNMASTGNPGDEYGRSVAIYDTTIIVGSPKDDDLVPNGGAAYIYNLNNNAWTEAQKLTSSFTEFGNEFYGYSVAIHKDRCVIGSTLDDDAATDAGTAFVYHFDGASWNIEQKLSPSDGGSSHSFGFSTSINDSILIIGAFGANNTVPSSGAAYIFRRNGVNWTEEEILFQEDVGIDDWFGFDVAIEGNTAIVSALNNDEFVLNGGSIYLIRYDEILDEWIPEFIHFANDGLLNWRYGFSCSLDGLEFVVGAPQATGSTVKSGAVYQYDICTHKVDQTLCAVSSDSASTGNYVLWENVKTTLVDSFYIFKSASGQNNFQKIGAVDYYDTSELFDLTDIDATAYSYKISTRNICGVESDSSQHHTAILLNSDDATGNVVLNWTVAEGYNFDFYRIYRDPQGDGTYDLIFAVLGSATTFTDFNPTGNNTTHYKVMALNLDPCSSLSQPFSSTYSNATNPIYSGIEEHDLIQLEIYPNPATDILNIKGNIPMNLEYEIRDNLGRLVQTGQLSSKKINLMSLQKGVYFLQFKDKGIATRKFIVE